MGSSWQLEIIERNFCLSLGVGVGFERERASIIGQRECKRSRTRSTSQRQPVIVCGMAAESCRAPFPFFSPIQLFYSSFCLFMSFFWQLASPQHDTHSSLFVIHSSMFSSCPIILLILISAIFEILNSFLPNYPFIIWYSIIGWAQLQF